MLISVSNSRIHSMLRNPSLTKEFPFLKNPVMILDCGTCSGKSSQTYSVDYNRIKRSIAEMPEDRKAVFNELNGWPGFSVRWNDGSGIRTTIWKKA